MILIAGGYIPTLETKQRECWKFKTRGVNSEFDSRVSVRPSNNQDSPRWNLCERLLDIFFLLFLWHNLDSPGIYLFNEVNQGRERERRKIMKRNQDPINRFIASLSTLQELQHLIGLISTKDLTDDWWVEIGFISCFSSLARLFHLFGRAVTGRERYAKIIDERRLYQEQVLPEQPCDAFKQYNNNGLTLQPSSLCH